MEKEKNVLEQNKNTSTEVLTTDEFIVASLKKYNIADAQIQKLKEDYKGLTIHDNQSYESVKKARQEVRTLRTGVEKKRKELKEIALTYGKAIDGEAKRLTELIEEVELPLDQTVKIWEDKKENERKEKERLEQEKLNGRITKITGLNCGFNGSVYSNGEELSLTHLELKEMDDQKFEYFCELAKNANDKKLELQRMESERLEKEKQEQEAEKERQRLENERLENEKKQIEEQRQKLENERLELEKQKQDAEKAAKQKLFTDRTNKLAELGFVCNTNAPVATLSFTRAGLVTIPLGNIAEITDDEFNEVLHDAKQQIENKTKENEKLELEYKEKIERETLEKAENERKEKEAEEQRKKEAEQKEQQRLNELKSDKEKLQDLNTNLRSYIDEIKGKYSVTGDGAKKIKDDTFVLLEKTYTFVLEKIKTLQ